ncbi:MAG: Ku protein [Acidobacteriota bacterium]|nr:Ku protein [Acidobacteriota bacterium]MDQ2979025.1 Ku protein [Acidobacteriota bacterium]
MSARSIANANISFGLVAIPVKLYSAANSSAGISFNLLHKKCGSRVKQQYICPKEDNIVVPRDEMTKGYEFSKDQYVLFSAEELKTLEEESTQSVDVTEFVPMSEIDPVYFDKAYYLGPEKGGAKAYWLLARALSETGRVALAKYAARGKQYLVMLRPVDGGLVMQQLLYADEVRPISEIDLGKEEVKDSELKLATMLVEQRASDRFHPEAYEDEVRKRIQEQLQKKIETGEEISSSPRPKSGEVIDLMEALRRSLSSAPAGARRKSAGPAAEEKRKPPKRAAGQGRAERAEKPEKSERRTGTSRK